MVLYQQPLFVIEEIKTLRHRNRKNYNQYFTPEFAVKKALSFIPMVKVRHIIDPAVGNGIFLKIASEKWSSAKLFGVDIDAFVIHNPNRINLQNCMYFTGDSLLKEIWKKTGIKKVVSDGGFDLVVGNPPFSGWFHRIGSPKTLENYKLAHRNDKLMKSQAIEVLFIEVFTKLVRLGGYVVIVLPDGILGNPHYKYVREFILKETQVKHVINLPRNIFRDTSAKTSILILKREAIPDLNYETKFHQLERSAIINNVIEIKGENLINRMDYWYYHNLKTNTIKQLADNGLKFVPLRNFIVYCKTGKTLYGKERQFSNKGLRFLHATNITGIGINYKKDEKFIDPSSKMNSPNAYAKVGDILFVRVGVGCAGRVAVVDAEEDEGIATDYIHIFRVKNVNPYFLALYLKTRLGRDSVNLLKHGVGTVSINKTDLLSLPIPYAIESLQLEIEEKYKDILAEYRKNGKEHILKNKMISLIQYLEQKISNYYKDK